MDNLFLKLPRDLQWEILTEFVGTHVVRNGKLMRKLPTMTKTLKQHIFHINSICPWHYSKYGTITTNFVTPCFLSEAFKILSYVMLIYRVLYYITLSCNIVYHSILSYMILHYIILY